MTMRQSRSRQDHSEIVVFTGDLVGSSRLSPADLSEAMRTLEAAARDMARRPAVRRGGPDWQPRFSAFRGDGWQCIGPAPRFALRGALLMRAHLGTLGRPFDTRVSIGIGSGWTTDARDDPLDDAPGDAPGLGVASGPAFELSGRALDTMKAAQRFAIAWQQPPEGAPLIAAILALCDEISRKWTPKQAEVFQHLLGEHPRLNQEALARALGKTQQTIAEHLAAGGDWALQEALRAVEDP